MNLAILRAPSKRPRSGERVSRYDSHFFSIFSLVLGILIAVAILLFVLAKVVGTTSQVEQVKADALRIAAVDERTRPFARVAVAGQDNAALQIAEEPSAPAPAVGLPMPKNAEELYNAACSACHAQGIGGAPRIGDKAAWAPRIAQGKDTLYRRAIDGFQGSAGVMPPKGGRVDLADDLIRQGVDHMVERSR
jgi:cytochrome c5